MGEPAAPSCTPVKLRSQSGLGTQSKSASSRCREGVAEHLWPAVAGYVGGDDDWRDWSVVVAGGVRRRSRS